jgi:hypothetical protein
VHEWGGGEGGEVKVARREGLPVSTRTRTRMRTMEVESVLMNDDVKL